MLAIRVDLIIVFLGFGWWTEFLGDQEVDAGGAGSEEAGGRWLSETVALHLYNFKGKLVQQVV